MSDKVYINGRFVAAGQARLSVHDAAVGHAVGLFETMQAFDGRVFQLGRHIERLIDSAEQTALTRHLQYDPLCDLVRQTLTENQRTEARVRLTITGGDLSLLAAVRSPQRNRKHQPTIICSVTDPTEYPPAFFEEGVMLVIADAKANPFDPLAGHKTLNYWARLTSLADAAARQAGEALWFSVTNHLVGGAVSNVFLVKDQQLFTPFARGEEAEGALPSPVLPGTTRAAVIDLADAADLPVVRKMLSINDVLEADEMFLTNSSWQVLPAVRLEKENIGDGKVGPMTRRLREALLEQIRRDCSQPDPDTA